LDWAFQKEGENGRRIEYLKMRSENNVIERLNYIFEAHKNERVCVVGTACCGKTTLLKQIPGCVDMDEALFSQLTNEESAFLCQTPWTVEIGSEFDRLVYAKVRIQPGSPMFGTVILDCDAVVYLDISDELLTKHCQKRNISFIDAKNMEVSIKADWENHKAKGGKVFYSITLMA
jgi:energy-coupling factor transporter ATP-binding protein EcfA2